MRPDLASAIERVSRLHDETCAASPDTPLLDQIEDALSTGYVQALQGDAWSLELEQRLQAIIDDPGHPVRGREVRALSAEHGALQRELIALRRALAGLRADRDRLRAASAVA